MNRTTLVRVSREDRAFAGYFAAAVAADYVVAVVAVLDAAPGQIVEFPAAWNCSSDAARQNVPVEQRCAAGSSASPGDQQCSAG